MPLHVSQRKFLKLWAETLSFSFMSNFWLSFYFMEVLAGTLDLYGNEDDYFLMLLSPYLTSTVTSVCCLDTCPLKRHSQVHVSSAATTCQPIQQ